MLGKKPIPDFKEPIWPSSWCAAGVRRVFVGGLATEFCVLATVTDALSEGFSVYLLLDAIQALEIKPGDARRSEQKMIDRGAVAIRWEYLA